MDLPPQRYSDQTAIDSSSPRTWPCTEQPERVLILTWQQSLPAGQLSKKNKPFQFLLTQIMTKPSNFHAEDVSLGYTQLWLPLLQFTNQTSCKVAHPVAEKNPQTLEVNTTVFYFEQKKSSSPILFCCFKSQPSSKRQHTTDSQALTWKIITGKLFPVIEL